MTHPVRESKNILQNTWAKYGDLAVATSSFQTQSVPLLHMISQVCPALRVVFLDTGFHFPETLAFRDFLAKEFGLNVRNASAPYHLGAVWQNDVESCCAWHKGIALKRALKGAKVWLSGIRQDQTTLRANKGLYEAKDGILRVHPVIHWTAEDIDDYMRKHRLPHHPLSAKGYDSIGCQPCTVAASGRAGRWPGSDKEECNLHR